MKRGDVDKRAETKQPQCRPKAATTRQPPAKASPAKLRDPLVKPKANDVVRCSRQPCGVYVTRKVFYAKGGTVVYQENGGPFGVCTAGQWAAWAAGGTVLCRGI